MTAHRELRLAQASASGGFSELGLEPPDMQPATHWYRVDADWGGGWTLVGETYDRIGYLALADRAWKDGAKKVRVYRCDPVGG